MINRMRRQWAWWMIGAMCLPCYAENAGPDRQAAEEKIAKDRPTLDNPDEKNAPKGRNSDSRCLRGNEERRLRRERELNLEPTPQVRTLGKTAETVQRVMPAVVSINAIGERETISPFSDDPFFGMFFGMRSALRRASGSGVIVDSRGYVATCAHVVKHARVIKVTLSSGVTMKAKAIFVDESLDLAILELDGARQQRLHLPALPLSTQAFYVGDSVIAIGNAFSVGLTVTKGIISAGYRVFGGNVVIQTDAQINPGNSGGPIIFLEGALRGTVAGIASAIASQTGASHGVGFFIPALAVQYALRRALNSMPETRVPLRVETVDPSIMEAFNEKGLSVKGGVVVMESCGELHEGDIIVSVAGFPVESREIFEFFCKMVPVGERFRLDYFSPSDISAQSMPKGRWVFMTAVERQVPQGVELRGQHILSGVIVTEITPELADDLRVESGVTGVVVLEVPERSFLRKDDIILAVNGQSVKSISELQQALTNAQRQYGYTIKIKRGYAIIQQYIH